MVVSDCFWWFLAPLDILSRFNKFDTASSWLSTPYSIIPSSAFASISASTIPSLVLILIGLLLLLFSSIFTSASTSAFTSASTSISIYFSTSTYISTSTFTSTPTSTPTPAYPRFASITVNLGPTFLSGALAANAGIVMAQPSCPLVQVVRV